MKSESYVHIVQKYEQIRFRDTVQSKSYNLDALVGNIGGYMGLFLGCALIQLPKWITSLLDHFKTKLIERKYRKTGVKIKKKKPSTL